MKDLWRRFARNRAAVAGLGWVGLLIVVAVGAPALGTRDPLRTSREPFRAPGEGYVLGTDNLGRDVYSGVVFGSQVSLLVGVSAAAAATTLGIAFGGVAGFYGGRLDALLMRTSELFQILPQFILALLIVALFGSGLEKVIFVIAILGWPLTSDSLTPSRMVATHPMATVKAESKALRPVRLPFITLDFHSGSEM